MKYSVLGQNVRFELSHFFQKGYSYSRISLKVYFSSFLLYYSLDSKIKFSNVFSDFENISNDIEVRSLH